jgi:hypothetical protein
MSNVVPLPFDVEMFAVNDDATIPPLSTPPPPIEHAAELPLALKLPLDCANATGAINVAIANTLPNILIFIIWFSSDLAVDVWDPKSAKPNLHSRVRPTAERRIGNVMFKVAGLGCGKGAPPVSRGLLVGRSVLGQWPPQSSGRQSQVRVAYDLLIAGFGANGIEFRLYALLAGGGCSHGNPETPNGIIKVDVDHQTWSYVANLSAFQKANPIANPGPSVDDWEPDGTWYSMVVVHDEFYAAEPNHQEIDRRSPTTGAAHRVADISASNSKWVGPTGMVYHGNLFFANLAPFPSLP